MAARGHGAHLWHQAWLVGQVIGTSTIFINTLGIFVAGRICDRLTRKGHTDAPI